MVRNRLEIFKRFSLAKVSTSLVTSVISDNLREVAKKYNYREYIKKEAIASKAHKKVLSGVLSFKGACERENGLSFTFETWLYFSSLSNTPQRTPTPWLFPFLFLGYIFIQAVINA